MNVKKSLENRIRGWLPKEPSINKTSGKRNFQINPFQPSPTKQTGGYGTLRATRALGLQALFWSVLGALSIIQVDDQNHIPLTSQTNWIAAGLTIGLILSAIFSQRQLKQFERNNEISVPKAATLFAIIVGAAIIIMIVIYGSFFFNSPAIGSGFLSSVFALPPTVFAARYVLFLRYEKKKEIYLMQYWLKSGFFAIPKSNTMHR